FDGPGERGFASGTLDSHGLVQITLGTVSPGTYQVQARVSDNAGNEGTSPVQTMLVSGNPFAQLPLDFEPNRGQTAPQVQYLSRARDYVLFLTETGAVLSWNVPQTSTTNSGPTTGTTTGDSTGSGQGKRRRAGRPRSPRPRGQGRRRRAGPP